jgi:hypothetical protein
LSRLRGYPPHSGHRSTGRESKLTRCRSIHVFPYEETVQKPTVLA